VAKDPRFLAERISIYPFDILANLGFIKSLLDEAPGYLDGIANRTMIDVGCSNGDLGFVFEDVGFSVCLVDKAHVASNAVNNAVRQNAPLVARLIAEAKGSRAVIVDMDIDTAFDDKALAAARADLGGRAGRPVPGRFGLGVMVGVLYHIKNPYSLIENLAATCERLVLGTWTATHMPDGERIIADDQVAYLLKDCELAADPTNYWIFTYRSLVTLVQRCGFRVVATYRRRQSADDLPATPGNAKEQTFLLLESVRDR
jgi:hypothetical protein